MTYSWDYQNFYICHMGLFHRRWRWRWLLPFGFWISVYIATHPLKGPNRPTLPIISNLNSFSLTMVSLPCFPEADHLLTMVTLYLHPSFTPFFCNLLSLAWLLTFSLSTFHFLSRLSRWMDSCGISIKRRQLEMFWQNLPDCSIILLSSLKNN